MTKFSDKIHSIGEGALRRDGAQDETIKFSSRCVARHLFITTQ
jgi:hypothetical protein